MTTNGPACGGTTSTVSYNYDASGRLTSTVTTALGVSSTTTYTAWDSSGRPTAGSFPGTTIANSYNDATRTWVQTLTPARGGASTTTTTFDANGNQVTVVNTSGNVTSTTTFNTTATARVCK
jgi:YD repeat-containing protein